MIYACCLYAVFCINSRSRRDTGKSDEDVILGKLINQKWFHAAIAQNCDFSEDFVYQTAFDAARNMFKDGRRGKLTIEEAAALYKVDDIGFYEQIYKDALEMYDGGGHTQRAVVEMFGLSSSVFRLRIQRFANNDEIFPQPGRKGLLTENSVRSMKKNYAANFLTTKTKVDPQDFKQDVEKCFRKDHHISMYTRSAAPDASRFQLLRLQKKILPEVVMNPTITNLRREQALNEPYNAIANAVIATSIMQPDSNNNVRFHPTCMANMDAMSAVIGTPRRTEKVLMPSGSKEAMKILGRSASRQSKQGK